MPVFGRIAYPVRAEVTKHVLPGSKRSQLPCGSIAAVGAIWETSKLRGLNITECLPTSKPHHGKSRLWSMREADLRGVWGRPMTSGEETGKGTRWDRRGWEPGIWRKICGDNIGNIPLAAGAEWQPAQTPETRLETEGQERQGDGRMSP